jgi:chloramphenicol 3-O phosphotransferase
MTDDRLPQTGKLILLNGASSSGKSSIARAVQARIEQPFWHISIDHLRDAGVLPLDRIRSGEFDWAKMREGFFRGFEQSLAAYAGHGANLIVEYIVETPGWMRRLLQVLQGLDVFFVGVHCDLEELERGELARGDRRLGDARRDYDAIHRHCLYDLELETNLPPNVLADRLIAAWRARGRPSAFERLAVMSTE